MLKGECVQRIPTLTPVRNDHYKRHRLANKVITFYCISEQSREEFDVEGEVGARALTRL
jgi:hypothetical protein